MTSSAIVYSGHAESIRLDRAPSAALVNAQHELAFRKRRVRNEGKDSERDELAAGWRDEIRGLRAVL